MLSITNFSKHYNEQLIIQLPSLSLDLSVYWFKGPNGSGKTTFFKSISGMIPFDGSVSIDDIDLERHPRQYRSLINYAQAEPVFPPFLTGWELIDFHADSRSAARSQVIDLVNFFGIDIFIRNAVGTYSSGMLKKLSILLAFIGKPQYIILDEPLVTLERSFIPKLYRLISKRNEISKTGFLISSHQALDKSLIADHKTLQLINQTIVWED